MGLSKWRNFKLNHWQRMLLIGLAVALTSQLYLSAWADGFRVSAAAVLYPALLLTWMRDSHRPMAGLVTGLCVTALRAAVDLAGGIALGAALVREYPGGLFYLCYDCLLCLLVRDRRAVSSGRLWCAFWLCDFCSNGLNLVLSSHLSAPAGSVTLAYLAGLALARSFTAWAILMALRGYRNLLLREEHERRYQHLYLLTANLKTELYFLKKDSEDIESVMVNAYRLYEELERGQALEGLKELALSIARDVHEVKKDNLRIVRGLEEEVAGAYDGEAMALSDLLHILEVSTRQLLGEQRADIRLECRCRENPSIVQHYPLLSILKNLVTNSVEAIQADRGRGAVAVDCRVEGEDLLLTVSDDGPGIPERARRLLFQVGYSTKFNSSTGAISRGVGLPAVEHLVEELGGTIGVDSAPGRGTCFSISLPLARVRGG